MSAGLTVLVSIKRLYHGALLIVALLASAITLLFYRWSLKRIGRGDGTSTNTLNELRRTIKLFVCCLTLGSILSLPAEMRVVQSSSNAGT